MRGHAHARRTRGISKWKLTLLFALAVTPFTSFARQPPQAATPTPTPAAAQTPTPTQAPAAQPGP
ncbi:MAG TPA: hypothetical protein VN282_23015, partial [Pyrinomonadaceae bacterium]|nr:hypothetical protein [Pyrinomonadaceae bacterium]